MDAQVPIPQLTNPRDDLKKTLPNITREALEFEESQWAIGSVYNDDFYTVTADTATGAPGTLLKVDKSADTSMFSLPPATALSRIVYQSKSLNGSLIPVSGIVLWPYSPRVVADGYPVVAWSHGTSGISPDCAPSHMKHLWQHFLGPYQLALQGYVVVATDYAGLGVAKDGSGNPIQHEYLSSPSHANDVIYSVTAARQAFPELSSHFVVMGHSQGGGSAWATAQRQATDPAEGYLGAVAVSPVTRVLDQADPVLSLLGVGMIPGIAAGFSDFNPKDILTEDGEQRLGMIMKVGACSPTGLTLLMGVQLLQSGWTENSHVQKYQALTGNGGKEIKGPLLVIHGEADPNLNVAVTTKAVEETLRAYPKSEIEYARLPGVSHVPALTASQRLWMEWIDERFSKLKANSGHKDSVVQPAMPLDSYQKELNWYIEPATQFYQTP